MSRGSKRKVLLALAMITTALLLSPIVFAEPFVKIETEGLKSVHIRANIIEEGTQGGQGAKNGRIQVLVGEIEPQLYSYKFQINFRKAKPNTEYEVRLWCQLDDITITLFGDVENPTWMFIEWFAGHYNIDQDQDSGQITTSLGALGLTEETYDLLSPETITTDERGSYKNMRSGLITEEGGMEYLLDLIWPYFRQYIMDRIPQLFLQVHVDLEDLGIIGLMIHGGTYNFEMGMDFIDDTGPDYKCEDIIFSHTMNDYHWGVTS